MPSSETGRFQPLSLLGKLVSLFLFGPMPYGFYLIQTIIIFFSGLLILDIVYISTKNTSIACLASVFFLTGSPVFETAYTLGKAEIQALFFLLIIFVGSQKYLNTRKQGIRIRILMIIFLSSVFAVWTKETLTVILIFGITGFLFAILVKQKVSIFQVKEWEFITIVSWAGTIVARGVYYLLQKNNAAATYTTYTINFELIWNNLKFYLVQQPDILFFGTLSIIFIVMWQRRLSETDLLSQNSFVITTAILLTGWAYFFGILLWRFQGGYYIFIPAALFQLTLVISGY